MQFLNGLDPDAVLSEPTRATILAKAQGNPFFLEEMTVAYAQSAAAVPEARPDLPDTIESQILVRFHHLPEHLQTLVQLSNCSVTKIDQGYLMGIEGLIENPFGNRPSP
jgi:predicted ATPase